MIYNGYFGLNESFYDDDFDIQAMMESESIEAAPEENLHEATFRIVNEMEYNWIRINEATCLDELRTLVESGETEVVTEASFGFIEKAKEFFRKLFQKIQEIFKNLLMYLSAKFGKNDSFYNKYKKSLFDAANTKSFSNMKFTGYSYKGLIDNVLKNSSNFETLFDETKTMNGEHSKQLSSFDSLSLTQVQDKIKEGYTEDKKKEEVELMRALTANHLGVKNAPAGLTDKEFKADLDEHLKGGSSKEQLEITPEFIRTSFGFLKDIDKYKSKIESALRGAKTAIDKSIRDLENIKKELNKEIGAGSEDSNKIAGKKAQVAGFIIDLMKSNKLIATTACGIITSNIKTFAAQSRMLAAKAITYNSKKLEESTILGGGSLVDSVELI